MDQDGSFDVLTRRGPVVEHLVRGLRTTLFERTSLNLPSIFSEVNEEDWERKETMIIPYRTISDLEWDLGS